MMTALAMEQIAEAAQGTLVGNSQRVERVCTDTRSLRPGDLFVALKGDRFDAHDFLSEAAANNAAGTVVDRQVEGLDIPQIVVPDTTQALGAIARLNRRAFAGPVIGITGSCGKTTVKNLIRSILSLNGPVLATRGNLNNQIGVPLTLLELEPHHQAAVVEMGANSRGEIAYLTGLTEPDIGVVTNAMQAHVEGFGSLQAIVKEKGALFAGLGGKGTAVINRDDPAFNEWLQMTRSEEVITFGVEHTDATFYGRDIVASEEGVEFVMVMPDGEVPVRLQLLGRQNVANALAAAACAYRAGASTEQIIQGLADCSPEAGRMQRRTTPSGAVIIDDSYNANPDSVKAAVDALCQWPGHRILVLGELAELGSSSKELHKEVGQYAREKGVNRLFTLGSQAAYATEAFGPNGRGFPSHEELITALQPVLDEHTVILIKGSRVSRMEKVVAALTDSGENN